MTRGKHAAQAAKRRAEAASGTAAELKATLASERQAWQHERAQLLAEIQRLRNRARSEIDAAASTQIASVSVRAREELDALKAEYMERATAALSVYIEYAQGVESFPMKVHLDAAKELGLNFAELLPDWHGLPDMNRHGRRRMTNKQLNYLRAHMEDQKKAGRGALSANQTGAGFPTPQSI